jgi:hypothetical protein
MPRQNDPRKVFADGKRGVQTIYNALRTDDPAIQLAAARVAAEAASRLPDAISEELRNVGEQRRRGDRPSR